MDKTLTLGTLFTGNATRLISEIRKVKTELRGMGGAMSSASTASTKASRGIAAVGTAAKSTSTATNKASVAMASMRDGATVLYGAYDRLVRALKVTAAYGVAGAAVMGFVGAMKEGTMEIINYDQALKNLQAITGATEAEISIMDETMRSVARTTKFSTAEVAEGMVLLGQAGLDASESIDAIRATANLATGTLTSMQLTADLVTTSIRAFSLNTKEASRVADVMANAVNKSKLTIDKLRVAFNFVAAAASQAGVTLEETAASMMVLANNGLRASTIGTGLRQVLARLISPSGKLREAYESYGISLDKINPATAGYSEALKNLSMVLWDHEKGVVNMTKAYDLFKLRGAQAAAVLVKSYMGRDFQNALEKVYEVGTAANMSAIQQRGLLVEFKNLADRVKLIFIALGDAGLRGILELVAISLAKFATALEILTRSTIGMFLVQISAMTVAVFALRKVFAVLQIAFVGLFTTMTAGMTSMGAFRALWISISTALTGFITPLTAVLVGLGAAAIVLYRFAMRKKEAAKASEKLAAEIKAVADDLDTFRKVLEGSTENSRQYAATIERITKEHPALAEEIKRGAERFLGLKSVVSLASLSFAQLNEVMKKLEMERRTESIKEQTKAIQFLGKEAQSMNAIFNDSEGIGFGEVLTDWAKGTEEAKKKTAEYKDAVRGLVGTMADWIVEGKATKEQVVAIINSFDDWEKKMPGIKAGMIEYLEHGLELVASQARDTKNEMSKFIAELPVEYQKFYEKLDVLRQADFVKAKKKMDQEVSEYQKRATQLGHTDEQIAAAKYAIISRSVAEYIGEIYKEYESEQENAARKLKVVQDFAADTEEVFKKQQANLSEEYKKRYDAAAGNVQQQLKIAKEYFEKKDQLEKEYIARRVGANATANQMLLEGMKATYEEATDLIKDQISEVESEIKSLEKKHAKLLKSIANIEEDYRKDLRKLRQKTMTDEEKWNNDREEARRMMNKAYSEMDEDLAEEAKDLFMGLAREVGDASGGTVRTLKETTDIAMKDMKEAYTVIENIRNNNAEKAKKDLETAKSQLVDLKASLESYQNKLKELATMPLTLNVTQAAESMKTITTDLDAIKGKIEEGGPIVIEISGDPEHTYLRQVNEHIDAAILKAEQLSGRAYVIDLKGTGSSTMGLVDKLIQVQNTVKAVISTLKIMTGTAWLSVLQLRVPGLDLLEQAVEFYNQLKDKTVTIVVNTIYTSSGGGGSGSGGNDFSGVDNALNDFFGDLNTGGRIGGYGGGDTVRAKLEPGEFVIRKESVARYGQAFFDMLNSGMQRFRTGGFVRPRQRAVPAPVMMQSGGGIGMTAQPVPRGGDTYHITVAPTYFMGDRASADAAGISIMKKMQELRKRGF